MRKLTAALASLALAVPATLVVAAPAQAVAIPVTFGTPGTYSWTVPEGVTTLTGVVVRGASGGRGEGNQAGDGAVGAQLGGTMSVTPGQVLTIYVAGQGADATGDGPGGSGGTGYRAGGAGGTGAGTVGLRNGGGGGGGSSAIIGGNADVIAGGGGGGGGTGGGFGACDGGGGGAGGATGATGGGGGADQGGCNTLNGGAGGTPASVTAAGTNGGSGTGGLVPDGGSGGGGGGGGIGGPANNSNTGGGGGGGGGSAYPATMSVQSTSNRAGFVEFTYQTVETTTAVAVDSASFAYGGPVTGTVTVTSLTPGSPASGEVTVSLPGGSLVTLTLTPATETTSTATFSIPTTANVGTGYQVNATYTPPPAPQSAFSGSSGSTEFAITQATTTTTVDAAVSYAYGDPVVGTVGLTTTSTLFPQGTLLVELVNSALTVVATTTIVNPTASTPFDFGGPFSVGEYSVRATFTPTSTQNYLNSSAATPTEIVQTDSDVAIDVPTPIVGWDDSVTGTISVTTASGEAAAVPASTVVLRVTPSGGGAPIEVAVTATGTPGVFSFTTSHPVGDYTFVGVFAGTESVGAGESPAVDVSVVQTPTNTTVSLPAAAAFGFDVDAAATVTIDEPGSVDGDATLTVYVTGTDTVVLTVPGTVTAGTANFTIPGGNPLAIGSYDITVAYAGTENLEPSVSARAPLTIVTSSVAFAFSALDTIYDDDVTGTVTLTMQSSLFSIDPIGVGSVVILHDGIIVAGPLALDYQPVPPGGSGQAEASFTVPGLEAGDYHAQADYTGDSIAGIPANTSELVPFTVAPAATTTTLTATPATTTYPGPVELTATVANAETAAVPEGFVRFTVTPPGGTPGEATVALVNGVATWSSSFSAGAYTATAEYLGNTNTWGVSNFVASDDGPTPFTVTPVATTTTLSIPDLTWNAAASATGTVVSDPAGVTITAGTVEILVYVDDPLSPIATATTIITDGTFTTHFTGLDVGTYFAVARYSGGNDQEASESEVVEFTIAEAPVTVAVVPATPTTRYGQAIPGIVQITPTGGPDVPLPNNGTVAATLTGGSLTEIVSNLPVSGGQAAYQFISGLTWRTVGIYTISATFTDGNYADGTSLDVQTEILPARTSTSFDSLAPEPVPYGETSVAMITVRNTDSVIPPQEGVIRILVDGVPIPGVEQPLSGGTLNPNGSVTVAVSLPTSDYTVGAHELTAVYVPTAALPNFEGSQSAVFTGTIIAAPTVTSLALADASFYEGIGTIASGQVQTASPIGVAIPDGSEVIVRIYAATDVGLENPVAEYTTTTTGGDGSYEVAAAAELPPGDYVVRSIFIPVDPFAVSSSDLVDLTVLERVATTTTVRVNSPVTWSTPITVSASVASAGLVPGAPSGTMGLRIVDASGGTVFTLSPPVDVVDGETGDVVLDVDWSLVPPGEYTVVGDFAPDLDSPWAGSVGETALDVVSCAAQVVLALDPTSVLAGGLVTATAEVTGITPGCLAEPTGGTVEFFLDGRSIGTGTVQSPVVLQFAAPGRAGTYVATATFLGTDLLGTAESNPVDLVVTAVGPLPSTGADVGIPTAAGVLLLIGGLLVVLRRRSRKSV
ncbi:LPXTG cell wall anchor domain-containing protein [Microbacterium sp. BWT-B31]|uniref:beta strand repeat-containing protein n=1 Tax=Microbacterium sp. BWT-B31 TaxID=3232072 RepID=UPI0035273B85